MPANAKTSASSFVPKNRTLTVLKPAVQKCQGCDLYRNATQAVFGELETGSKSIRPKAAIMVIGEQPGDREDEEGRPFVGPAGKLLDRCLVEAQIDRRRVYVTNAVKHFKWESRGKLRIHKKPSISEIHACKPWLEAEAVAAQSLLGPKFKITQSHGEIQQAEGLPPIIATLHPAAILRARTDKDRNRDRQIFIHDLEQAASFLGR